jgi:hypothetical protein
LSITRVGIGNLAAMLEKGSCDIYNTDGYRYPGWDYALMREPVRGGLLFIIIIIMGIGQTIKQSRTSKLTGEVLYVEQSTSMIVDS